jgi:hypothetical protein
MKNEVLSVIIRWWTPEAPAPGVALPAEEWLSIGHLNAGYTAINSVLKRAAYRAPHVIVLFVDQRVAHLDGGALIEPIVNEPPETLALWSPSVSLGGGPGEPWHEPINPYAWAARGAVLALLRPVWDHHLQFGHEALMADACTAAGIEMCCRPSAVAKIGEGKASEVTNALYYRQLEDAAAVARVRGVEGPSG